MKRVSIGTTPAWSNFLEVCVLLLAVACSSTKGEAGTAPGNDAGRQGQSGGDSSPGGATGSGGAMVAGSGGAPVAGTGSGGTGTAASAGAGGSGGVAGAGVDNGGQAGTPSSGGASAGSGTAGDGAGGGAGAAAGDGGTTAGGTNGGASGSANGGAPAGCDWMNTEGRIALFDGTTLSGWQNSTTGGAAPWRLVGDGSMEVVPADPSTNIETAMKFEDICLHLEYLTPMYPENVTGQQRGNSGIYFKRSYEMQVLDSSGQPPAIDGCGAVYGISPPLEVACNMQLVWNTYEIEFKGSRWNDSGAKIENAVFVSATLNGTVVQRDVELDVPSTTAGQPDSSGPQALMLQDHGNPVRFRNIWAKIPNY